MRDEILGRSSWTCTQGHEITVQLFEAGGGFAGGSSWDYCDWCDEMPDPEQVTRMTADILDQARASGKISQAEWEAQIRLNRSRQPRNVRDRIAQAIAETMVHGKPVRLANIGNQWQTSDPKGTKGEA